MTKLSKNEVSVCTIILIFFYLFFFILFLDMHNIRGEVSLYGHLMYQSHRQSAVTRENVFSNWFASGCQLSVTKGAAQEPHDYFGLADCSALIGSAAPDLPCCNIDVAAGLKPRVYDCIGFYCHLKEILGQRLRDMQI